MVKQIITKLKQQEFMKSNLVEFQRFITIQWYLNFELHPMIRQFKKKIKIIN